MKRSRKKRLQRRAIDQSQEVAEPDGPLDGAECFSLLVSETALLTAAEEVQLARTIQAGGPKAQVALTHFITANQRLVYSIAKRYKGQGLDWEDLVQEGNIGLLRAINRFDPERGNKFSTMAVWWIRQSLARAVADKGTAIRLPVYLHTAHMRLKQAEMELMEELDDLPTNEQLAKRAGLSLEQVKDLRQATGMPVSLSDLWGEHEDQERGESLADPECNLEEDTVDSVFSQELQQVLLATLNPREYFIIRKRFGLQGEEAEQTLREVSQQLGISRERVRQMEERAIKKLRAPQVLQVLAPCLEA